MRSRESQIYSAHPVERLLRILEALSFWHASTYWHVKSLTILLPSSKSGRLVRRKAFLLCKNPCGAGCNGGRGTSSQRTQPRAKKFSEKICFAPSWVYQVCRTPRLESTQKYVSTLNWYNRPYRAAWGARGAAAPLFPKESRENSFEGFSLGNFFLTADAVLLCAAKKNSDSRWRLCRLTDMGCRAGVGKWTSWQVSASLNWRLRHCKKKQISY